MSQTKKQLASDRFESLLNHGSSSERKIEVLQTNLVRPGQLMLA